MLPDKPSSAKAKPPRSGGLKAMALDEANAGAVAFSRSGDPNLGEFEDAVILKTFGQVPDDFADTQTA